MTGNKRQLMETMYICYRHVQVRSSSLFFCHGNRHTFSNTETVLSEEQIYSISLGVFWVLASYAPTGR